jgi:hypothetical protein
MMGFGGGSAALYYPLRNQQVAVARGLAESVAGTGITVNSVLADPTASG